MKKILVVEDDKNVSKALGIRLAGEGYSVYTAVDGLGGLREAVQNRPDLILLDISMPAGDGFSVAKAVQRLNVTAGTPIIFITASRKPGLREHALTIDSVVDYIEKPYDPEELLGKIRAVIGDPFEGENAGEEPDRE